MPGVARWQSLFYSDQDVLESVLSLYAPRRRRSLIVDVTWGRGVMWQGVTRLPDLRLDLAAPPCPDGCGLEFDLVHHADYTDLAATWWFNSYARLVDVLVFDPPHAMDAGRGLVGERLWAGRYGTRNGSAGRHSSIAYSFPPFLEAAKLLLSTRGVIAAKIGDQVHGGCNQWEHVALVTAAREAGLHPCDYAIVVRPFDKIRDPKWVTQQHVDKTHALWLVIRNSRNHG